MFMPASFFDAAYHTGQSRQLMRRDYILAPLISNVDDNFGKQTSFRIRYHLFGNEILRHFSGGDQITLLRLKDKILKFISSSRNNSFVVSNAAIVELMYHLFISRDPTIDARTTQYSRLITSLKREGRNYINEGVDASKDVITAILSS